ncbi:MAG: potassium channel family protein [Lentimicrobium sp.]
MLYKRRFTLFLISFLLMLFGDIFISQKWYNETQTVFILQNMLVSFLLFQHSSKLKKLAIITLFVLAIASRIYPQFNPEVSNYSFVTAYLLYFLIVSYQLFRDLLFQKELGIETLSAAFSGFILIGTFSSIIFISMDSSGAFRGPDGPISNSDYLYFSFVTLLTIGYGDIVPITEISKKAIILIGLIGHFYTVFVVGIVIGKFLKDQHIGKTDD